MLLFNHLQICVIFSKASEGSNIQVSTNWLMILVLVNGRNFENLSVLNSNKSLTYPGMLKLDF